MSRLSVASQWAVVAWLALLPWHGAQAQAGGSVLLFKPPSATAELRWHAQLESLEPFTLDARAGALAQSGVPRARIEALAEVERLLSYARARAAEMDEDAALSELARAASLADDLGDVPGVALWQAEVQVRIGITAAQAGLAALSESAFRRASALDPARQLQSAEAPPGVVERFERAARARARSPSGRFLVRANVPGAEVYLDDVPQGAAPARVQAVVGRHVLRVEAPGYRGYGAGIDVLEGERSAIDVLLSPTPALDDAARLAHAAERGDYPAAVRALSGLDREAPPAPTLLVLESSADGSRGLLVRCRTSGCNVPLRLEPSTGAGAPSLAALPHAPASDRELKDARAWLEPMPVQPQEWWQRWYVWGGVAIAGAALATVLIVVTRPEPERRLSVQIEPAAR